jgi:Holliday junction resolvasome, endonuclease subunit
LSDSLRILGIDPGSRKTGYGFIEHSGNKSRHLDSGFIKLNEKETLAERLYMLSRELGKIIDRINPNCGLH